MSDGSNSSHSTIEDTNMDSPRRSQASGTSTPHQTHDDSDALMTPSATTAMDQDTPSNQTPAHPSSSSAAAASPSTGETLHQHQQHPSSPLSSAPSTPSSRAGTAFAPSPMAGVVSTSTPPPSSDNAAPSSTTATSNVATVPSPARVPSEATSASATTVSPSLEEQQRKQAQEQQLLLLQRQAQLQQQAQASASTAAAGGASTLFSGSAAAAAASVTQHNLAVGAALQSRKEEELNRKDRTLAEFLPMMENYNPIIPEAVTDYYLSRTGFDCEDVRIKRLLALAAQKFVSDIATDAFQYCKVRQQSQKRVPGKEKKTVLTMEDLSDALGEYGINVKKPDYFM
ncbi:Transcription initiation factor TFIID subunit 10 [Dissophora globulifera]|nr:Transcription initiation factor TFIID subunit 10 [Dissophora globulifera]